MVSSIHRPPHARAFGAPESGPCHHRLSRRFGQCVRAPRFLKRHGFPDLGSPGGMMGRVQTTNTDLYSFDSWFPVGRGSGSNSGSFLFRVPSAGARLRLPFRRPAAAANLVQHPDAAAGVTGRVHRPSAPAAGRRSQCRHTGSAMSIEGEGREAAAACTNATLILRIIKT